jgi:Domain of unknown function (DUF4129)
VHLRSVVLAAIVALAPFAVAAQPDAPVAIGEAPAREDVRKALDKVANDPNLATARTVNMLRFKKSERVTEESGRASGIARWFRGFFGWVAESARLLVWVIGGLAAALLVYYIARVVQTRGLPQARKAFVAPSHVRDLDIRPESLPVDVGAAALDLWQRGEQRAALALLYRAMLSRFVHAHSVPIRASSTEGECLALARPLLAESSARYAARLVDTWAAAVYGARQPDVGVVEALCGEFATALDGKAAA